MDTRSEVHRLTVAGYRDCDIARELDVSRERVRQIRGVLGLQANRYQTKPKPKVPRKVGLSVTVLCDQCGNPVTRKESEIRRRSHTFCNKECFGRWLGINHGVKRHPENDFKALWDRGNVVFPGLVAFPRTRCVVCGNSDFRNIGIMTNNNPATSTDFPRVAWCGRCGTIWAGDGKVLRYKDSVLSRKSD